MGKILTAWNYLQGRFNEPSTHAAISGMLMLAGVNVDAGVAHNAIVSLGVVFGCLGIFVKESKPS